MRNNTFLNKIIFILFILNLIILLPSFLPRLKDIDTENFGESLYINSGRLLVEGKFFDDNPFLIDAITNRSPLPALFYAAAYIPFQNSSYWLIYVCAIGRFLFFCLLWLCLYLISKEMTEFMHLLYPFLLFVIFSFATRLIITDGSDALFTIMSGFSFWQVLVSRRTRDVKNVVFASIFLALAFLSRSEGFIIFVVFIPVCLSLNRRTKLALAGWILPYLVLVGAYVGIYAFYFGGFEKIKEEASRYSYFVFEQSGYALESVPEGSNQWNVGFDDISWCAGFKEAPKLYGSAEENNYSIIRAIRNNPKAFFLRTIRIAKKMPKYILLSYGGLPAVFLFLLTAFGVYGLFKKNKHMLLSIFIFWPSYILLYELFGFRQGYFLSFYFIIFILSSIGLSYLLKKGSKKKISFQYIKGVNLNIFILLLCVILFIQGQYYFRKFLGHRNDPEVRAALFMKNNLRPGTAVGSVFSRSVFLAKLNVLYILPLQNLEIRNGLIHYDVKYSEESSLEVIYADKFFRKAKPFLYDYIMRNIERNCRAVFTSRDRSVQIIACMGAVEL